MSFSHSDRFLTKLIIGFSFVIGSIFTIMYASFERATLDDWYPWAIVASILLSIGLYFSLSAFVHKIKSDFVRRKKDEIKQRTTKETR